MQSKTIALVLVSSLVFAGCSLLPSNTKDVPVDSMVKDDVMVKDDAMMEEAPDAMQNEDAMMEKTTGDDAAMMKFDSALTPGEQPQLVADNFTYGVDEIRVKQGETLTVSVMNANGFHDFKIDELSVDSGMIPEGETMEITIPTDVAGTYEYYCSVGQHRAMGMKGTLIIE